MQDKILNSHLRVSKNSKNDEFYTCFADTKEILFYHKKLKNKVIYCNTDDPNVSNFFKFFNEYRLVINFKEVHFTNIKNEYFKEANYWILDGKTGKVEKALLKGNGDLRSHECIDILKKCDIVITNPPFSIFREFFNTIVKVHKKDILIIGNILSIGYKDIYPHIVANKLFIGRTRTTFFTDHDEKQITYLKGSTLWLTTLKIKDNRPFMILQDQDLSKYKKYDNMDAIDCSINNIPKNYNGVFGIPLSGIFKLNSKQFKIVGVRKGSDGKDLKIDNRELFTRLLVIKKKNLLHRLNFISGIISKWTK